jgi:hypothetical protein
MATIRPYELASAIARAFIIPDLSRSRLGIHVGHEGQRAAIQSNPNSRVAFLVAGEFALVSTFGHSGMETGALTPR